MLEQKALDGCALPRTWGRIHRVVVRIPTAQAQCRDQDALGGCCFGLATIVFGLSSSFVLSLGALAVLGGADMLSVYVRSSLVQLNTPDAMRGRVSSVSGLAVSASNELGEMQSGLAAAVLGPVGAVVFGGAGAIFVTGIWA